jgi:formylmethanofuran dehydrogenase subunit C
MTGFRLSLRAPPPLVIDASALLPAATAPLALAEMEKLVLPLGRETIAVAELFRVQRMDDGGAASLTIEGDLSRFDRIGAGMAEGTLRVTGSVGDLAGEAMAGGRLTIDGDALDALGCAMRGGWLEVKGRAGDRAGSALPGEADGMRGGTLVIHGDAGDRCGDRMRRGTLAVLGDAGALLASRMVAGTIALAGRCGPHAGYGMRRGSVVFAGAAPDIAPTFVPVASNADVFWQLLARDLARFGGAFATLPRRHIRRHAGDLAVAGKGELLIPE